MARAPAPAHSPARSLSLAKQAQWNPGGLITKPTCTIEFNCMPWYTSLFLDGTLSDSITKACLILPSHLIVQLIYGLGLWCFDHGFDCHQLLQRLTFLEHRDRTFSNFVSLVTRSYNTMLIANFFGRTFQRVNSDSFCRRLWIAIIGCYNISPGISLDSRAIFCGIAFPGDGHASFCAIAAVRGVDLGRL